MRSKLLGLAAVLAAALLPLTANAASKAKDTSAGDAKSHQSGMAEAASMATQLKLNCTPTDANMLEGTQKDPSGKQIKIKINELVCQEGLGYVVIAPEGGQMSGFDCLALTENKSKAGSIFCKLPANANPLPAFQTLMATSGATCTPTQGRYVGSSENPALDQYEIGCSDGTAYLVEIPRTGAGAKISSVSCLAAKAGSCQYMPKDKVLAAMTAMAAPAGKTSCQISDARYVGTVPANKNTYYEVACADGSAGYLLQVDANNKFVAAIDCARAAALGGCSLSAAVEDLPTYSGLVKQIGYPCALKGYRSVGVESGTNREIVEVACSDHPDGAFAFLPVGNKQQGEYFNCARAEIRQLQCTLSNRDGTNAKLTTQVAALGQHCKVSNYRGMGRATDGTDFVELACVGEPGLVIQYAPGPAEKPQSTMACLSARSINGGCKLQ